jgi:hypothetical protein
MILKMAELNAIKSGEVSLIFRRWRRPNVSTGGSLRTAIGVLAIDRVIKIKPSELTEQDAAAAGYTSLSEILDRLDIYEGDLYRIEVRYAGPDPRVHLQMDDKLDHADFMKIVNKLDRLDSASRSGPWTRKVLLAIERHPKVAAAFLSESTGFEKKWLKANIRKLKNLGLTISHQIGYELSPRGKAVLHNSGNRE